MALASWPPGATAQDNRCPIGGAPAHDTPTAITLGAARSFAPHGDANTPHYSELSHIIKPGIPSLVVVILAGIARLYG